MAVCLFSAVFSPANFFDVERVLKSKAGVETTTGEQMMFLN